MKSLQAAPDQHRQGHELLDGEDAVMMIAGLEDKITIQLEGADITRGTHKELGFVTIVVPVAGNSTLLYPFEKTRVS